MSKSLFKPSSEAADADKMSSEHTEEDITIENIQFVNSEDLQESIKESSRKTEIWTLTSRLESIDRMTPVPILKKSNWQQWQQAIQDLLSLSQTSAAFLTNPPSTKPIRMWSNWWVAKLNETAPNIHSAPSDPPRVILNHIVRTCNAKSHSNVVKVITQFWDFKPDKNSSLESFIKEYGKRYQNLREHSVITSEVQFQMKYILLDRISILHPELSHHCHQLTLEDIISECLEWTPPGNLKSRGKRPHKLFKCNYCKIAGHKEEDCRKKKKSLNEQSGSKNNKQTLSLDKMQNTPEFQLDTAADFHVSGKKMISPPILTPLKLFA